ncbi:MAG: hypothetical protein AAF658_10775, partial [Myxococcota bacterium]
MDGTPDTTLNGDGTLLIDSGGGTDVQRGLAVGPNEEWLLTGSSSISGNREASLYVLRSDGTPSGEFGSSGFTALAGPFDDIISDSLWLDDGSILVGGTLDDQGQGSTAEMFAARFTAAGALDPTFGTGGIARYAGNTRQLGWALAADSNRVFVGGTTWNGTNNDAIIVAWDTLGNLDTTWATAGVAQI